MIIFSQGVVLPFINTYRWEGNVLYNWTTPFHVYSCFINTFHQEHPYLKIHNQKLEGLNMKTIYDIQQYLKKFGTLIYVGDRLADLELMEVEVKELYHARLMDIRDYQMAILLLRQEVQSIKEERKLSH